MDVTRVCRWCSKPVPKGRRAYCSEECYEEYAKNTYWDRARARAVYLQRVCQRCGTEENLEVHHIKPIPKGEPRWKNVLNHQDNLLVLCELHHEEVERARRRLLLREEAYRQVMEAMRAGATPPLPVQLPLFAEMG